MKILLLSGLPGAPFFVPLYASFLKAHNFEVFYYEPIRFKFDFPKCEAVIIWLTNLGWKYNEDLIKFIKTNFKDVRVVGCGPLFKHFSFDDFDGLFDGVIKHYNPDETLEVIIGEKHETETFNPKEFNWKPNKITEIWCVKKFKYPYPSQEDKIDLSILYENGCERRCSFCGVYGNLFKYPMDFIEYIMNLYVKFWGDKEVVFSDLTPNSKEYFYEHFKFPEKWVLKLFYTKPKNIKNEIDFVSKTFRGFEKIEYTSKDKIKYNIFRKDVESIEKLKEITLKFPNISFEIIDLVDIRKLNQEFYKPTTFIFKGKEFKINSSPVKNPKVYYQKIKSKIIRSWK